ncbi:MAG: hypothetical protein WDM76_14070 [Limisphaerales bacterium]
MAAKRRIEDPIGFEWSKNNVTEISPTVGYVETVVGNNNLIVHQLLEQQAVKYPVLITLFRRANNIVIASFRSRNGDALKVAEKFQGWRPRQRRRRDAAQIHPQHFRRRGLSAPDLEPKKRRAVEQSGKFVCGN